jgi:hypothetical protein
MEDKSCAFHEISGMVILVHVMCWKYTLVLFYVTN